MIALLVAAGAAQLVPAHVDVALLLENRAALQGVRAFLASAGRHAPALAPEPLGRALAAAVGVDLLDGRDLGAEERDPLDPTAARRRPWGLADGPRAVMRLGRSVGLSAPLEDPADARAALDAWVSQAGRVRIESARGAQIRIAGRGRRTRAGAVLRADRVVVASGELARLLVTTLLRQSKPLEVPVSGPAVLYLRGWSTLIGVAAVLAGNPQGLSADGVALAKRPLLSGPPAAEGGCAAALFCARAGLGAGGKELLAAGAREWIGLALRGGERDGLDKAAQQIIAALPGPVLFRLEALHLDSSDPLWIPSFTAAAPQRGQEPRELRFEAVWPLCLRVDARAASLSDVCDRVQTVEPGEGDAQATLDSAALAASLRRATPLELGAYAARLLFAPLLDASGPITLRARPEGAGARIELRWPLPR